MVYAAAHAALRPPLPVPAAFRLPDRRAVADGFDDGGVEPSDHAADAGSRLAAALHPCDAGHGGLCVAGVRHVRRRGRGRPAPPRPRGGRAVAGRQPADALSGRLLPRRRYLRRCRLGQCVVGTLLGLGSQGGMGRSSRCWFMRCPCMPVPCRGFAGRCFSIGSASRRSSRCWSPISGSISCWAACTVMPDRGAAARGGMPLPCVPVVPIVWRGRHCAAER